MDAEATPELVIDASNLDELAHPFGVTLVEERPPTPTIVVDSPQPASSPTNEEETPIDEASEEKIPTPEPEERIKSGLQSIIWPTIDTLKLNQVSKH